MMVGVNTLSVRLRGLAQKLLVLILCNRLDSDVVRENSIWNERERAALCLKAEM